VDSLLNLCTTISDEAQQYCLHLTTGQFLCLAETAKNFEAYNYEVRNEETESCLSSWQNILKRWLQTFTKAKSEIEVKAIWGLYNRRSKGFKELRKSYNARGDVRVKETLLAFLNEPFDLPKKKTLVVGPPVSDSLKEVHVGILTEITNVNVKKVDISHIHSENRRLRKFCLSQTSLIECKNSTIKKSKEENENLKAELSDKRKQLKEVEKKKDSLKTVDKLMKKQTVLLNRSKQLRDLKIKYKYQEKNMQELNSEICQLKSMTTEALDFVDRTENEKIELANTLTSMNKKLKSKQKKVIRTFQILKQSLILQERKMRLTKKQLQCIMKVLWIH
jgi:myosin heavy subunit